METSGKKPANQAKSRRNVRYLVVVALLAAISTILMYLEFPLPIFPSFLKFDFSDLPALIGAFALGPLAGVLVELVKNLIHLTVTQSGGVGELANFLVGTALVLPAGLIYKYKRTRGGAVWGMVAGGVAMAAVGALANYFILIPFYTAFMPLDAIIAMCAAIIPAIDSLGKVILFTIVPFNLLKALVVGLVTFLAYKPLSRLIRGKGTA